MKASNEACAEALEANPELLERAKRLLQAGDRLGAERQIRLALDSAPDDIEALYILAATLRYLDRLPDALAVLAKILSLRPNLARALQEIGHCRRRLGETPAAINAYERAVAADPALIASWKALNSLYSASGKSNLAEVAASKIDELARIPSAILVAKSLIAEKKYMEAEAICRSFLQKHGHNIEAMRVLADIGILVGSQDEAEFLLESCVLLAPEHADARYDYANLLMRRQKFAAALDEAKILNAAKPDNPAFQMLMANVKANIGDTDAALELYLKLNKKLPNAPEITLALGHTYKTIGSRDLAIDAYRRTYKIKSDYGDAFWSLANLKTYRFSDEELSIMRRAEAAIGTSQTDRYHLCFALGKALEDRQAFAEAFSFYERGNRLKRQELRYDPSVLSSDMSAQISMCTRELFESKKGMGNPAPDPIFIVGLPRAGSTLLEQILASHPLVDGTMELSDILAIAHRLEGRESLDTPSRYPDGLGALTPLEFLTYGTAYLEKTRVHRRGAPFFVDKMPNNFRHIGLIHLILPNAKIIDARRDAFGCCFSCYKQLFAAGQEFTYDLNDIGHYYRDYVGLMDHWDRVLPGKVLRVNYEAVVGNLEDEVRRLLDFCELPFEEACIHFHQTERAVRTASSEQVRQPLFTSGLDQWTHFSEFLDPLRAALGPELVAT